MNYRKAKKHDLPQIMELVKEAQAFLYMQDIDQWQDGYPNEDVITADMMENESFVFEEDGQMLGYITIVLHPEKNYEVLFEGKWNNTKGTEGAMHHVMISSKARGKGLSKELFSLGERICQANGKESMRIDTHPDNKRMQHVIENNGFIKCGQIKFNEDRETRYVYEKVFRQSL